MHEIISEAGLFSTTSRSVNQGDETGRFNTLLGRPVSVMTQSPAARQEQLPYL